MLRKRVTIIVFILAVLLGGFVSSVIVWGEEATGEEKPLVEKELSSSKDNAQRAKFGAEEGEKDTNGNEDKETRWEGNLDRSISIMNMVATLTGILLGLLALLASAFGVYLALRLRKWDKKISKVNDDIKFIGQMKIKYEGDLEGLRENLNKIKPIIDSTKKLPKKAKQKLDEFTRKLEESEVFGIEPKGDDYFYRGTDFYEKGNYELALESFDKAIELKPDWALAWYNKGTTLARLKRYEEALKTYDKAIDLKRDWVQAWYGKGIMLGKLERYEDELKAYDKAIELNLDYGDAWINKSATLDKLRRYDEALKACDKAIKLKPCQALAWYNRACTYALIGDKENALKDLAKAIKLDKKFKEDAKTDEDFKSLWDDPDFKKLVE